MPRLSVWAIRLSLAYLGLGFTFGGLMLWNKGLPLHPALWSLLPAHIEFLLFGWTVQLILGMAFWILPRFNRPPRRGREDLAWLAVILLNVGVFFAGFGPLAQGVGGILGFAGRAAEVGAALVFAAHAWPRVKAAGV
jgi:heme/copper-type cytochrome/quinol oxidase subunit 1